ncbi:MAG: gluconate 2-dehydrogenase subunit 3 family protein [Acidobacteria bacterium]|jgi:gluconate 2-dehydrogenase gamma chain|nr:gluconate 2-dehydrogenase subunit 3 family protein [Acidobacteriota bacterium]
MAERRDALKIIGSISATCAFPFAADELYAQHEGTHGTVSGQAKLPEPAYFSKADFVTIAAMAERIIPQTDTPGAGAAGVPAYIDFVVGKNPAQQKVFAAGLAWLKKQTNGKPFAELDEKAQLAILEPLCARCDAGPVKGTGERFFKTVKALTADGYWTSKAGMADTLGFKGNAILGAYPECLHEH